jgi:hypothetical protein
MDDRTDSAGFATVVSADAAEMISKLDELHALGRLSDEEYNAHKSRYSNSLAEKEAQARLLDSFKEPRVTAPVPQPERPRTNFVSYVVAIAVSVLFGLGGVMAIHAIGIVTVVIVWFFGGVLISLLYPSGGFRRRRR